MSKCDHCGLELHHDRNGYWVGPDGTSDCQSDDRGHQVDGQVS